jgi:cytochrome P450 family 103
MKDVMAAFDGTAATESLPVLKIVDLDADPHGMFRKYRVAHGLVKHETGCYLVLRHADIERLGNDPRAAASETAHPEMLGIKSGALSDLIYYGMLYANGALHRRRRSPFARSFAARMIVDLRPNIRRLSMDLIDNWYRDGQVEFVEQFAAQLPTRIIGDLFGLPRAEFPTFTKLVYEVTRFFRLSMPPGEIPEIEAACRQLRDYVEETLDDRRGAPSQRFPLGLPC